MIDYWRYRGKINLQRFSFISIQSFLYSLQTCETTSSPYAESCFEGGGGLLTQDTAKLFHKILFQIKKEKHEILIWRRVKFHLQKTLANLCKNRDNVINVGVIIVRSMCVKMMTHVIENYNFISYKLYFLFIVNSILCKQLFKKKFFNLLEILIFLKNFFYVFKFLFQWTKGCTVWHQALDTGCKSVCVSI